jgi:tRNA(Ile)-lysidine synthase
MLDQIANILHQACNVRGNDRLMVGVSGGPDSMSLLHILNHLGYKLIVGHFNHKLRPEASEEACIVDSFARQFGLSFISAEGDVPSYARENSMSIEEAARQLRYQFLFKQAQDNNADAVLVAHTADDQIETILLHLLRGSGLAGLTGMNYRTLPNPWSPRIPLVRPLLSTWRTEIDEYLLANNIKPITDQSNLETAYKRNRIRHELLPLLESYNPRIRNNLIHLGHILREDYSVLQDLVDTAWKSCLIEQTPGCLSFHRPGFIELPVAIQRYLLRRAVAYHLPGMVDVGFDAIERGRLFLLQDRASGQVNVLSGLWLIRNGDSFALTFNPADLPPKEFPSLAPRQIVTIIIPSRIEINNGWILEVELCSKSNLSEKQDNVTDYSYTVLMNLEELEQPLILRARKPGDRIQPLGMGGHSMKISDMMINLKLPERVRESYPLVCSGGQVIWIPGYRLSEIVRVKDESKAIVRLALFRESTT